MICTVVHSLDPNMQPIKLKTPLEAKNELIRKGVNLRQWSKDNNLSERIVYGVLRGEKKGRRGASHKAAVLLGIKDGVL